MSLLGVGVSLAFTLLFGGGFVLMAVETWLLATGQPPLTIHVRRDITGYPGIAVFLGIAAAFGFGALFAHFYWDAGGTR